MTINLFWVLVSAINFLLLLTIIWMFAFKPLARTLDDRKAAIEQASRMPSRRAATATARRRSASPR